MQHILLLHGAIGAKDQLIPLADELTPDYTVHLFNFAGHGGDEMPEGDFSFSLFVQQVLDYLDDRRIDKVSLFGYSMGGYVAMCFADLYPVRINRVITLATKFHWDEQVSTREVKMLDPVKVQEKVPAFAKELQERHSIGAWQTVLEKTARLLLSVGKNNVLKAEDIRSITAPVLLLLGDRDKMVSLEETVEIFKQLQNGRLGIMPGTAHPIEQVPVKRLAFEIREFMN
jgi:pimeloyl-ACP methyl ester carboxylesterase